MKYTLNDIDKNNTQLEFQKVDNGGIYFSFNDFGGDEPYQNYCMVSESDLNELRKIINKLFKKRKNKKNQNINSKSNDNE